MAQTSTFQDIAALVGRLFIAFLFVLAGASKIPTFSATVTALTSEGVPMASAALALAIAVELGGGIMIMFGWKTKLGALLLFLFTIVVTFYLHDYWTFKPEVSLSQLHLFLKNISIMGGILYIMAFGPGAYSVDAKKEEKS